MRGLPMALRHNWKSHSEMRAARSMRFNATILLLILWCAPLIAYAEASLKSIEFSALPGDRVQISLGLSAPVDDPVSFTTENPARISLDFTGVSNDLGYKTKVIGVGPAHSVTALQAGNRTRVVINLTSLVGYNTKVQGSDVLVTLDVSNKGIGSGTVTKAPPSVMPSSGGASEIRTDGYGITNIDFRRGEAGEGRVMVTLTNPSTPVDVREEGGKIVVEAFKTEIDASLVQSLDVMDFATPIIKVETKPVGENVRIEISPTGEYDYLAYQANEVFTVEVRSLTRQEKEALQKERLIFTGERLSLNFQDIEVRAVLQLLADFTGLNLVTSDTVGGRITLRLKNVPWDQALDIILKSKGLTKRQIDNVIMVAPTEEVAAREQLELESQQKIEELAPLRSDFIQVNYAKAEDLATLLKAEENRLLSERGNVTVDVRTNTLLIQDTAAKLEDIRRLLKRLDIPVRQVLIESRIVIANNDFAKDLGVRFGANFDGSFGDNFTLTAGALPGYIDNTFGVAPGIEINNEDGENQEGLMVNLPVTAPSGGLNFLVGKVGSYLLQLELTAMQTEGRGELISSPRVITSDQTQASIKQGVEIPYQEATSSGATKVSFKEALLKLDVTPHITPDDRVRMDLVINKDNPDFSRSVLGVPPIDTREIETTVLVDNGETVVLGGVFERTKQKNTDKVPFFGDIPYAGVLFRRNENIDNNNELLIFVTPKILKETLTVR
ncbi:MAG: type IV pilus secretin PilQ [Candidatus Thiodiazotropha sp. (ex Lucina aurantia)]|nr:type IV pilus secretin PilQ [Candidatus Thiodiazotropha sp. (ex Lucina pensylvanica)]MBT3022748.1 type IV pilus secretin PilQ [Candidatus Thiodiazotropha taylori]MBV2099387.1 type IV pilus secretin PilQ [Candidatus Thiodiazotropha sp. (ex Codakia orbicularis)]MBV2101543.1 type IV pilus secretin PilQ [Candidatus Thiodiazotropha sp. (ex Lucina aurantia)]MBV2115948.1 type IV pilus secretin PilQ [Candidatus Thiodiazotropha sp. (ex Lucina aurantia)]